MKNLITLLLLILVIQIVSSRYTSGQHNQLGLEFGYGATSDYMDRIPPWKHNYKNFKNYLRIGFLYSTSIKESNINFMTGLNYDTNIENKPNTSLDIYSKTHLSYIRIPCGIELHIGKRSQIVTGLGLYISGLAFYSGIYENSGFEETVNRVQFGGYSNFGFEYQIHEKYCFGIGLQGNKDFTKLYEESVYSLGGSYYVKSKGYDIYLKINLKYNLANENITIANKW